MEEQIVRSAGCRPLAPFHPFHRYSLRSLSAVLPIPTQISTSKSTNPQRERELELPLDDPTENNGGETAALPPGRRRSETGLIGFEAGKRGGARSDEVESSRTGRVAYSVSGRSRCANGGVEARREKSNETDLEPSSTGAPDPEDPKSIEEIEVVFVPPSAA